MAKKVIVVNGSPRSGWNTDMLLGEAAKGAASKGAEIVKFDWTFFDGPARVERREKVFPSELKGAFDRGVSLIE